MSPKAPKKQEPEVTCPVCGNVVTLDDPFCPHCGAEFEEEEVEEIIEETEEAELEEVPEAPEEEEAEEKIEVEEETVEAETEADEGPAYVEELTEEAEEKKMEAQGELLGEGEEAEEVEAEEEIKVEEEPEACAAPEETSAVPTITTSIFDHKVIGITLLMLGIISAGIMLNVGWFWTWVPPITSNLGVYALIAIAIIALSFLYVRKMATDSAKGKAPPHPLLPSIMLATILLGILVFIMFIAAGPITSALVSSNAAVSLIFILLAIIGLIIFIFGPRIMKSASKT